MQSKNIYPLMPKGTACWLINETSLTFLQIAEFCGIHELEVQGIANDDIKVKPVDPIENNQLTRDEITRCENSEIAKLALTEDVIDFITNATKTRTKYTNISRRGTKPAAIMWLLQEHPNARDKDIVSLLGTTKNTITRIRKKITEKDNDIEPKNPVALYLCSQNQLNDFKDKNLEVTTIEEIKNTESTDETVDKTSPAENTATENTADATPLEENK